jgi:hypothetical protein
MNRVITRIQLFKDDLDNFGNQVEGFLDVEEDAEFPINFSIGDIRDISKRSGSFSKTIKLAGSKNNNILLNNYFEVNVLGSNKFNLNKKQSCAVIQNGIVILDNCYLRLINVKKVQKYSGHIDELVSYEVEIRDNVGDFFNEINNKELTDLNLSEFNHIYTAQNVVDSFTHSWVEGYKYVMPWIDNNTYLLKECFPGVYAKTYWDKIHSDAGYVYEWSKLSDDDYRFDKLIIPFNGDIKRLSEDVLDSASSVWGSTVSQNVDTTLNFFVSGFFNVSGPWAKINSSFVGNNFNIAFDPLTDNWTNPFIIDAPQSVTFQVKIEWDFIIDNISGSPITSNGNFLRKPYVGVIDISSPLPFDKKPLSANFLSPGTVDFGGFISRPSSAAALGVGENIIASGENTVELTISPAALNSVWELQAAAETNLITFDDIYLEKFRIKKIDVKIVPSIDAFGFNYPVEMNKFIPQKIKQSDFIKSIYKMFNLYVEVDKTNKNKLIYKTRDEFYDGGEFKDWTGKLSKDREQELVFIPEISFKRVILSYKQDGSDEYLKAYFNNTNEVYGQIEVIFDNENVRGEDRQELIFSPTINQWTSFGTNNPVWVQGSPKNNIRILLDGGVRTCGFYNIENYVGNEIQVNYYPFISMLDEPVNPNLDIAFGINDYYPYDIENFTSNNLYTKFWRRTFAQINTGKMLSAYFWLNEEDIFKLKLNDIIKVNNALWYINKVVDYKANKKVLTKVELLSVEDDLKLPRFGRIVGGFIFVNPPITPNKSVGPMKPIVEPLRDIVRQRNNYSSVSSTTGDYMNFGKKNIIKGDFSGVLIGDNLDALESGFYVNDTTLTENELNIKNKLIINEESIKYTSNGVTASIDFIQDPITNDITVDIVSDFINFNGSSVSNAPLKFIINSSQILNSFTSPVELVPAPGPNKILTYNYILLNYIFDSVPYLLGSGAIGVESDSSTLLLGSVSGVDTNNNNFVGINQPIRFLSTAENPTDGNGRLDVYIFGLQTTDLL